MSLEQKHRRLLRILKNVDRDFAPAAFACSFNTGDMILADAIFTHYPNIEVFTLDTGRLHEETYSFSQRIREHYGRDIKSYFPDPTGIEEFVNNFGPNMFYQSIDFRKLCCQIRKAEPLTRALNNKRAWITGLRSQYDLCHESEGLSFSPIQWDKRRQIPKINPLFDWSNEDVEDYVNTYDILVHPLYDSGYKTIDCEPCTKSAKNISQSDLSTDRWWWESVSTTANNLHK